MREYSTILVERRDRVLKLTLNRPERLNAVNPEMDAELSTVFADIANEPEVDIVILTGAGRAFSAGGDMDFLAGLHADAGKIHSAVRNGRKIIRDLLELDVPIIAQINGDAIGLGATIALHCDIVYAAENARIGDPHVRVGLVAGDGGSVIWPLLIGPARAKEYLLTGRLMSGRRAEQIGLINAAYPAEEVESNVNSLVEELLALPQLALRGTKRSVNERLLAEMEQTLELSLSLEAGTMYSDDFREAVAAFVEKRKPVFRSR